jgi:hypothetical protein
MEYLPMFKYLGSLPDDESFGSRRGWCKYSLSGRESMMKVAALMLSAL